MFLKWLYCYNHFCFFEVKNMHQIHYEFLSIHVSVHFKKNYSSVGIIETNIHYKKENIGSVDPIFTVVLK